MPPTVKAGASERLTGMRSAYSGHVTDPDEAAGRVALDLWAAFPVNADPRPLVLSGPTVLEAGFRTNEAKVAYLNGAIRSDVDIPPEVLTALRPQPRMRRQHPFIRVLAVERSTAEFSTDRGRRSLPAFRVTLEDALEPVFVLDPEVAATAWRPPGVPEFSVSTAVLHADGRSITFAFTGTPRRYEDYPDATVMESETAAW
jgi:hypothetical protein